MNGHLFDRGVGVFTDRRGGLFESLLGRCLHNRLRNRLRDRVWASRVGLRDGIRIAHLFIRRSRGAVPLGLDARQCRQALALSGRLEIDKLDGEIGRIDSKLANENFTARAPAEVVAENRAKRTEFAASRERLVEALERLAHLDGFVDGASLLADLEPHMAATAKALPRHNLCCARTE